MVSAAVAVTLIAAGSISLAIVFAAAVRCGDTRRTVRPVAVIAADARIVYAVLASLGARPEIVKTIDAPEVKAVTSI